MKINYTVFAERLPATNANGEAAQNHSYYSLYAVDDSGLISDEIGLQVVYVLNNYTLYGVCEDEYFPEEYSFPVTAKCIVSPMQVPRNLRIVEEFTTHNTLKISWDKIANITKYGVYVKNLETGKTWKTDVDKNSYILTNLKPDHTYEIQVASHIQYNFYSELSTSVIGTTLNNYFENINVKTTLSSVQLSWKNIQNAEYYKIYYGVPGDLVELNYSLFGIYEDEASLPASLAFTGSREVTILASSANAINEVTFLSSDLETDTQYLFYIVALDGSGKAITSQDVYATTLALMPAAPDIFSYIIKEITAHSVTIAWSPAARARHYRIHLNNNPEPKIDYIFYPEIKITGLNADTIYTITIVSVNSGGEAAATPFAVRTARGGNTIQPTAPRLIYPNCNQITADFSPSLYWQLPNTQLNIPPRQCDFLVELSNNQDILRPLKFNSKINKAGFSFVVAQPEGSNKTLNYRLQKEIATNNVSASED